VNDLIQRIVNAIFREEGAPPTAFNPGNIRPVYVKNAAGVLVPTIPWLHGTVRVLNGFWLPDSRAQGIAGAAHCVALRIAEGQTLAQTLSAWAPPSDGNNTAAYIANVKQWTGIADENVPLYTLIGL